MEARSIVDTTDPDLAVRAGLSEAVAPLVIRDVEARSSAASIDLANDLDTVGPMLFGPANSVTTSPVIHDVEARSSTTIDLADDLDGVLAGLFKAPALSAVAVDTSSVSDFARSPADLELQGQP